MENRNHYQEIILVDKEYFISLIEDINTAKQSIDLETYIFSQDEIGKKVAVALIHAANRGVKIRLLIDGIGTRDWGGSISQKIENSGILVKTYHPLFWSFSKWPHGGSFFQKTTHLLTHFNSRNHRKTCLIDNKIVYIGSANITASVDSQKQKLEWHDVTVKVIGATLTDLQFAFDKAWGCISFKNNFHYLINHINVDSIFRLNFSWRRRRKLYKDLLYRIKSCKKRIWITNAYFFPKSFLLIKLIKAAQTGIDVRIVIPKHPDVLISSLLSRSFYSILLESGVTIMQHLPGVLHAKILILDDWFCVGSSNLNHRSLKYDLEVDLNIQTQSAKNQLEDIFKDYCKNSSIVSKKDKERSLIEKIIVKILLLLKSWF